MHLLTVEGQDFAPVPLKLTIDLFLEHKASSAASWQRLQLSPYDILQAQGPFVHQAAIPRQIAGRELRLRVSAWHMYYTISLEHLGSSVSWPVQQPGNNTFRNAVVIGDIHSLNCTIAAQVLATHMTYHLALGFDLYLVYIRGSDLLQAVHSNNVTAKYIAQGQLLTVSLDALQIPLYDEGWAAWAAYDPTKLVAYNHAALFLWQEKFHLAVIDMDELWAPGRPLRSVNEWFDSCYAGADVISATRMDVICQDCLSNGLSELAYFQSEWDASDPLKVLENFSHVASFNPDPKSVFAPDKVGQVWLHKPAALSSSNVSEVFVASEAELTQACVVVIHLPNLFEARIGSAVAASSRHQWLGPRHRSHSYGIEHI